MKNVLLLMVIIIGLLLVTGCSKKVADTPQGPLTVNGDAQEVDTLDEELDTSDLDTLDSELDDLNW